MGKTLTCWEFMKKCAYTLALAFFIVFCFSDIALCLVGSQYCGALTSFSWWFFIWPTIILVSLVFYPLTFIPSLILGPIVFTLGYVIAGIIQTYIIGLVLGRFLHPVYVWFRPRE